MFFSTKQKNVNGLQKMAVKPVEGRKKKTSQKRYPKKIIFKGLYYVVDFCNTWTRKDEEDAQVQMNGLLCYTSVRELLNAGGVLSTKSLFSQLTNSMDK
jgi:hypothetical protein